MRTVFIVLVFSVGIGGVQAQDNKESKWNAINQKIVDLYSAGNYEDAIYIARQNKQLMETAPRPIKIVFYNNLAGSFLEADIVDSAIFYYSKAVELALTDTTKLITSLINLREAYAAVPDFNKALEINNQVLQLAKSLYPPTHPLIKDIKDAQAYLYIQTGKPDSAIAIYKNLLSSANITDKPYYYKNMGIAMLDAGNDSATVYLRKAVKAYSDLLGPVHPETVETKYLLAKSLLKFGHADRSNTLADSIIVIYKDMFQEDNPEFARIYALKANALLALGKVQEAEEYFRQSVNIVFKFLGSDNPVALSLLREWGVPEEYFTKVR